MRNEKLRKALAQLCEDRQLEENEQPVLLDNHDYDGSIIGITEDNRIVYSMPKMIEEFMKDESCSYEDAVEWLEYNTLRALPYAGEKAPIVIEDDVEGILEKYGE